MSSVEKIIVEPEWALRERDTFLLAQLLPTSDSPKLCALIYDAVVAELGFAGTGYDPQGLFDCGQRHFVMLYPAFKEALDRGFEVARAEGWC